MIAFALVALLATPAGATSNLSTSIKASEAMMVLFKNLDDRISSKSCDSLDGTSYKGKTVGELLAARLGAEVPEGTERKFSVECVDTTVSPKPGGKKSVAGWACTLFIERPGKKDDGGGTLTFYLSKEPKRYLRDLIRCNES
jgi:hypothetical protein